MLAGNSGPAPEARPAKDQKLTVRGRKIGTDRSAAAGELEVGPVSFGETLRDLRKKAGLDPG